MPESRDMTSLTSSSAVRWRRTVLLVSTSSRCLGFTTAWLSWELISRMTQSLTESSSRFHLATKASFSISLYKPKRFDHLIKANVPTPRCLHQPIDGALELAYLVSIFRIDKTFRLHHIQFFLEEAIKECRFDMIWFGSRNHKLRQLLTWFGQASFLAPKV